MSKMVGGCNMIKETKKEDFYAFKKLIKRYKEITREEIAKGVDRVYNGNVTQDDNWLDDIKENLTGFGNGKTCILCQDAGYNENYRVNCKNCDWVKLTENKCTEFSSGDKNTYRKIHNAQSIEDLYQAYKDRAKYMEKVLKEYEDKHKLPEIGKCPFCGSEHVRVESVAPLSSSDQTDYFKVHCMKCKSSGPLEFTKRKAIEEWNKVLRTGSGIDGKRIC